MAVTLKAWGVDVGQSALKAVRLCGVEMGIAVDAFEIIEHVRPLSDPNANRDEVLADTLARFAQRAERGGCHLAASVSALGGFSWWGRLPPMDGGAIPLTVRFEAQQQVPYPFEEAIWRWQTFRDPDQPDAPDVDAGVFALHREAVGRLLLLFSEAGINVDTMQMAPLAMYNVAAFERLLAREGATLLVDVGAGEVDVVLAEGRRLWVQAMGPGSSRLTQTVAASLGVDFAEADQRLRAVADKADDPEAVAALAPAAEELAEHVADLVIQYAREHSHLQPRLIVGAGQAVRLPGVLDALESKLQAPARAVGRFGRIEPSAASTPSAFVGNIPGLVVAYGLALQELDLGTVHTDFRPPGIARQWGWKKTGPLTRMMRGVRRLLGR